MAGSAGEVFNAAGWLLGRNEAAIAKADAAPGEDELIAFGQSEPG
jgi:hypothetical protein